MNGCVGFGLLGKLRSAWIQLQGYRGTGSTTGSLNIEDNACPNVQEGAYVLAV